MNYNIINIEIEGFKKIKGAFVTPKQSGVTLVTGANEAGKSSVIDAILYALEPKGVTRPINSESGRAKITLRIGNEDHGYIIERTVTESDKYLKVKSDDGKPIASAQTFLNSLKSAMADPLVFMEMKPQDQCDALRLACGCDTRALDQEYNDVFSERTIVNRQLAQAEANVLELGGRLDEVEPVSAADLMSQISEAESVIKAQAERAELGAKKKHEREVNLFEINSVQDQIRELEERLVKLKADDARLLKELSDMKSEYVAQQPAVKVANESLLMLKEQAATIDEHNKSASIAQAHNIKYDGLVKSRNEFLKHAHELTERLDGIIADKKALLESSDFPVKGMLIEGNNIYVDGIPFNDLNTAKRIEVATYVAIAQNPKIRLIVIRHGSLLDDGSLAIVAKVAEEQGYQVVVEKVSKEQLQDSIHIVEGKIQE